MNSVEIRKVDPGEVEPLQKISRQTFFDTFSAVNTEENMNRYLTENLSIERMTSELSDTNSEFYFALIDDEVIGYLKLNFGEAQTDPGHENTLEIERIYVLSEYHGNRVGQILFEKAISIAGERQSEYIWLGVWEHNPRAIAFYKKNGFTEFGKHPFMLGDDKQTDILMKLNL